MIGDLNSRLDQVLLELYNVLIIYDWGINNDGLLLLRHHVRRWDDVGRASIKINTLLHFNRDVLPFLHYLLLHIRFRFLDGPGVTFLDVSTLDDSWKINLTHLVFRTAADFPHFRHTWVCRLISSLILAHQFSAPKAVLRIDRTWIVCFDSIPEYGVLFIQLLLFLELSLEL